ncbi:MAG: hypothetical protein JWO42_2779 [Chloroflexi bacterium]|jgi:CRP/FNR family cyclic AMP-dependent transcriptional regulator|nr:hypothetical protein [Chloroflexota bacterium]
MNPDSLWARIGIFRGAHQKPISIEKLLAQVGLFRSLDQKQLAQLALRMETRRYEPGHVIVAENETGDALHIVESGLLHVCRSRPGREPLIISSLGPGQFFCETALVGDYPRAASIVAAEASTCLALGRERFQEELAAHPAMAVAMVVEVSRRLRDTLDLLDANA